MDQCNVNVYAGWLIFPKKDEDILKEIKSCSHFVSFEEYCL